jgi:hypothetical protein
MRPVVCALLLSAVIGTVQAGTITGLLWAVPDGVAQNAVLANIPARPPDVTFEVNAPLNFFVPGTVDAFLLSGGAFNIAGSPGVLNSAISPSLIEFNGQVSVTTGEQFTVTHDDGLTLTIGGLLVIDVPSPTAVVQTTSTYTGSSGTLPFTLVYGECCGGGAVLQIDLPFQAPASDAPEPATFGLAAGGLILAIARFRSRG